MSLEPDTIDAISGPPRPLIEIPLPLAERIEIMAIERMQVARPLDMILIAWIVLHVAARYFEALEPFLRSSRATVIALFLAFSRSSASGIFCPWRAAPVSRSGKMGYGFETHKGSGFVPGKT
jgi:hypothetical protein